MKTPRNCCALKSTWPTHGRCCRQRGVPDGEIELRRLALHTDQQGEGVRTVWDVLARVQSSHGASSLQLELPLTAMTSCMRDAADPSAVDSPSGVRGGGSPRAAAFIKPDATCRICALHALDFRQLDRAGYLVQRARRKWPGHFPKKLRRAICSPRRAGPGCLAGIHRPDRGGRDACSNEESAADPFYAYWLDRPEPSPSGRTGTTPRRSRPRASSKKPVLK